MAIMAVEGEYLLREVHDEFADKVSAENARQNARIDKLETTALQINELALSVKELAINMEGALKQLTLQNTRLETLEGRAGENWRKVVGTVITGVVGAVVGFLLAHAGIT